MQKNPALNCKPEKIKKILSIARWITRHVRKILFVTLVKKLGRDARIGKALRAMGGERIVIGEKFACDQLCTLNASFDGEIKIGNHVSLASNVTLNASFHGFISIKDNVMIGPNTVFRCSSHSFELLKTPMSLQSHCPGFIKVGNNVWIGANVVILRNISIGDGAIVGAGSVVTKNIAPNAIVAGVPAKTIRMRNEAHD